MGAAGTSVPCGSGNAGKPDESSATARIALTTAAAALPRAPALHRDLRDGLARFASAFCHRAAYSQVTDTQVTDYRELHTSRELHRELHNCMEDKRVVGHTLISGTLISGVKAGTSTVC